MNYQVIARKYRPRFFKDVVGQEHIVTTLKNSLEQNRVAHAYLFSGSRGTGKTTIARILAKSLNCANIDENFEPCGKCSSCKEIHNGSSLEVIEIDGASNRGIDDIRQINDNVKYTAGANKYKIYIIDEVHMLTKEAFNALLKTLEEPPEKVKFFLATTEPHKILPTITSRCQRYHLNRIGHNDIVETLESIAKDLNVKADDSTLNMIARLSDGGLRDAESLLDQLIALGNNSICKSNLENLLGLVSADRMFELDKAVQKSDFSKAFEISEEIFSSGKNLLHFIEELIEHYRTLMQLKLGNPKAISLFSPEEQQAYQESKKTYSSEQCLHILELLTAYINKIKSTPSKQVSLEIILLQIIRSSLRIPIESIVYKLMSLEKKLGERSGDKATNNHSDTFKNLSPQQIDARIDTLVQFTAVEMDGKIYKH